MLKYIVVHFERKVHVKNGITNGVEHSYPSVIPKDKSMRNNEREKPTARYIQA